MNPKNPEIQRLLNQDKNSKYPEHPFILTILIQMVNSRAEITLPLPPRLSRSNHESANFHELREEMLFFAAFASFRVFVVQKVPATFILTIMIQKVNSRAETTLPSPPCQVPFGGLRFALSPPYATNSKNKIPPQASCRLTIIKARGKNGAEIFLHSCDAIAIKAWASVFRFFSFSPSA